MSAILVQAAKEANLRIVVGKGKSLHARYPVFETEFWDRLLVKAKDAQQAQGVLDAVKYIEDEPCIESDSVWRAASLVKAVAKLTLGKHTRH